MNRFDKSTEPSQNGVVSFSLPFQYGGLPGGGIAQKNWIDYLVDFMFFFLLVFNMLPGGAVYAKYMDVLVIGILLIIFAYRRQRLNFSCFKEEYLLMIHLFGAYVLLSAGWALNMSYPLVKFVQIEKSFILFTFFYVYYREQNDSMSRLLRIIEYAGLVIALIYIIFVGIDQIRGFAEAKERMEVLNEQNELLVNVNMLAMVLLIPFVSLLASLLNQGLKLRHLSFIPIVVLIFATGSRKGSLGLYLAVILVYLLSTIKFKKGKQLFLIFSTVLIMLTVLSRFDFSLLTNVSNDRLNELAERTDSSTLARIDMAKLGWKIFLSNPLVGCGIGCPRIINERTYGMDCYLHNDFLEILAGGGIVGGLIYYPILVKVMITIWRELWKHMSVEAAYTTIVVFVVFMELLLFKVGSVTFYDKEMILLSLPVFVCYGTLRNRRR